MNAEQPGIIKGGWGRKKKKKELAHLFYFTFAKISYCRSYSTRHLTIYAFLTLGYDFSLGKSTLNTWEEIMFYKCLISNNYIEDCKDLCLLTCLFSDKINIKFIV